MWVVKMYIINRNEKDVYKRCRLIGAWHFKKYEHALAAVVSDPEYDCSLEGLSSIMDAHQIESFDHSKPTIIVGSAENDVRAGCDIELRYGNILFSIMKPIIEDE